MLWKGSKVQRLSRMCLYVGKRLCEEHVVQISEEWKGGGI